jgi:hypothetical protein
MQQHTASIKLEELFYQFGDNQLLIDSACEWKVMEEMSVVQV